MADIRRVHTVTFTYKEVIAALIESYSDEFAGTFTNADDAKLTILSESGQVLVTYHTDKMDVGGF